MSKKLNLFCIFAFLCFLCFSCEKENNNQTRRVSHNSSLNELTINEIDAMATEIASFHSETMYDFLQNQCLSITVVNKSAYEEIIDYVAEKIRTQDFATVSIVDETIDDITQEMTWDLFCGASNVINTDFDFTLLTELNDNIGAVVENIDVSLLENNCKKVDNQAYSIIEQSSSFEDFTSRMSSLIKDSLETLSSNNKKDEYFYSKLFVDVYMSSIDYITQYLYGDQKGPRWDKFKSVAKQVWNDVRPIVAADAEGAVTGAMIGAATGPGVAAGAMAGGCGQSAGYCVGKLIKP